MMKPLKDIWAVVPVKEFTSAKTRLSSGYSPEFRLGLAKSMVEDVLCTLANVRELTGIVVVTRDRDATKLANRYGARVFEDGACDGQTGAVMAAARRLASGGHGGILALPGDIPNITVDEVSKLFAAHGAAPSFSIVPAHDRRGSNAILMTPPDVVPLSFGNDSFLPHLDMARRLGIEPKIVPMPGIGLDIDNLEDIALLIPKVSGERTRAYLAANKLLGRGESRRGVRRSVSV